MLGFSLSYLKRNSPPAHACRGRELLGGEVYFG